MVQSPPANVGDTRDSGLKSGSGRSSGGGPTPVFMPGESHGQMSPVGYCPLGHKELDMTEATEHAKENNREERTV